MRLAHWLIAAVLAVGLGGTAHATPAPSQIVLADDLQTAYVKKGGKFKGNKGWKKAYKRSGHRGSGYQRGSRRHYGLSRGRHYGWRNRRGNRYGHYRQYRPYRAYYRF